VRFRTQIYYDNLIKIKPDCAVGIRTEIIMKLKDFKKWINKLTDEELEQHLFYNSEEYSISGKVHKIEKAKQNLYYTGDDDPSELYTLKQLKDQGYDKEDIESFEIEIPKGSFYIKIGL
jgi:hypothetical protein